MTSVKVAVRVRPLNQRELDLKSRFIIEMDGRKTRITNVKIPETACEGDFGREAMRLKEFTFDFSFWSTEKDDSNYSSQDQVFKCLGLDVVSSAYDGYNACVFAYGQTGSGKSYTMMGNEVDQGLIPKICKELFSRMTDEAASYRTEVSYLEIYNEKVRDLLQSTAGNKSLHTLRVREHPKEGPYVQDLSMHFVSNYEDIRALMIQGNTNRTTAATTMNDVSSRSHAIFTILFTQAKFIKDMPSEIHSKIHLVDLAGSERADVTGATGQRLKEGASINKSLVTLGNVISILAEKSEEESKTKNVFIPYRDSVLTWLLKDSLGGNSRTIMVATISPADVNYGETLSTLRYANRAKSIINRPTVNEDPNVRLIRELREEISRLRALLGGNIDNISTPKVQEKLHENEARVKILTEEWTGKWKESANILQEQKTLALRKEGLGVVLDSELPHLIGIDDDILSTGIMLYHLKEGITAIGKGGAEKDQDIVIAGVGVEPEHCVIQHYNGVVILSPVGTAVCTINGINVISSTKLTQGAVILLGKTNMFRFNHPAEAAKMRKELKGSNLNLSRTSLLSQSMNDLYRSTDNLSLIGISGDFEQIHKQDMEKLEEKRQQIEGLEEKHRLAEMDRLTKQAGMEQQLEAKRHEHHRLQQLVEHLKKETEKAQLQVRKEQAILKRRSQDLEKQFQDYLEEKEKFQVEREMERAKRQKEKEEDIRRLAETKGDICQEIEAELKILAEREQQQNDNLQRAKKELMQELEDLKKQMAQHQMELRTQIKEMGLENLEKAAIEEREDDKIALENEIQEIHADIYSESKEVEELNFKLHEVELKLEECGGLDDQWWSVQSETVKRQWLDIESREKELIEDYCTLKKDLEKKHKKMLEEMSTEKQQYETAWLELEKLEREKLTALENIQDEAEMESYQRELLELEKAKRELQERRKELDNSAKKLHEEEIQLELLFKEEQNQYKEDKLKLKTLEKETLFKEIQGKNLIIQEKQKCVYQKELLMQDVDRKKLKGAVDEFACRVTGDEHKQCSLQQLLTTEIEKQKAAEADINKRQEDLENQTKTEMKIIAAERQRLLTLLEEHNIGKKSTTISAIDSPDIEASASDSVTNADQLGNKEDSSIKLHAMELDDIRKQFESAQMELDDKRKKFEEERDAELDRIEFEKLKLQEMENQERINALVEQEVKRRLFEEKVQREKHRRIEREEEKKERDNEIKKLRMMHSRELKQLKAKYERNEGLPSASVAPSKSNPYATVMSPDSVEHKTRRKFSATQDVCNGSSSADTIKISIPTYMLRSYGSDTHYEYEVKIVIAGEAWSISRRYSRFRKLHHDLKLKYSEVGSLVFPPKKLFSRSEKVVAERRYQLEAYLQNLIEACKKNLNCSLHPSKNAVLSKQLLCAFDSFFKKGLFEATRHGTS